MRRSEESEERIEEREGDARWKGRATERRKEWWTMLFCRLNRANGRALSGFYADGTARRESRSSSHLGNFLRNRGGRIVPDENVETRVSPLARESREKIPSSRLFKTHSGRTVPLFSIGEASYGEGFRLSSRA